MKTDRQSLEALEERLNDPELYVDAIDDAVDVIIQLERERDEIAKARQSEIDQLRKAVDELARVLEIVNSTNAYQIAEEAIALPNQLPHVIDRNKSK